MYTEQSGKNKVNWTKLNWNFSSI